MRRSAADGRIVPVDKSLHAVALDAPVGDRRNVVYAGTTVTYGRAKAIVTSTGMHAEFGKIAAEVSTVSGNSVAAREANRGGGPLARAHRARRMRHHDRGQHRARGWATSSTSSSS